jgi:hypothetical protein
MWTKTKSNGKTILFVFAIVLFLIGVSNFSDQTDLFDPFNEPSQYYFTSTFLIMFFSVEDELFY